MSIPLDTMSVATRISIRPLLNSRIIWSRCDCSKSECISPTFSFMRRNAWVTSFTFNFDEAKTITLSGACSLNNDWIIPNFWFS